ncbi:hypothetical protein [Microbacterium sp. NPDC056234]|uniref:hypothetical protein n=1 Tax=Microbacterium sp. NPDC056234 TaxID=3345757 RepID=UPI0035E35B2B
MTLRRGIAAAVALIAVTVALLLLGLEPMFALSGGALAAAVALLAVLRGAEAVVEDGPQADEDLTIRGTEISRLAWAFNPRTGVAGEIVSRRVRALLRRRIARQGIDVDDPSQAGRLDEILGTGLWQRINGRQVQNIDIRRALDAADRLASAPAGSPEQTSTSQSPIRKQERA